MGDYDWQRHQVPPRPGRNFSVARRCCLATALLMLGLGIGWQGPALATDLPPPLVSDEAAPFVDAVLQGQAGKQQVAQQVAQANVEDEFGPFNLFIIFFVTLGPLKVIPTFVQLTQNASRSLRRQLAFNSTVVATAVILLVVLVGRNIMEVWQIQLPALMIAGGILLSLVALQLVLTQYAPREQQTPAPEQPDGRLAITPLAFPTILPPFGIAIALTLMVVSVALGMDARVVIALLVLVMLLNLVCMLAARPIFKFIRPVTLKILGFTLGVMQFALGIQFILTGLEIQALVIQILLRGR
jgi:multiple antibiotic resistance protein